jgi:hypothetical protein
MAQTEVVFEAFRNRPVSDFFEELRFEFQNLPDQLFQYYLVKTARHMANEGALIRRRAVIHANHCVTRYLLESPDGMEINSILSIHALPCGACTGHTVIRSFTPPEHACCCGREIAWYDDFEHVLHVQNPYTFGEYFISLSVTPSRDACELPTEFYDDFLETLLLGTKANILLIQGRPWTNMQLGQGFYNEYLSRIKEEGLEVATHKMRGAVKINFGRAL